jgi:hypothetical protein
MRAAWRRWRRRRYEIRQWRAYWSAVNNEEWYASHGLGHPEWVQKPGFPDPRIPKEER